LAGAIGGGVVVIGLVGRVTGAAEAVVVVAAAAGAALVVTGACVVVADEVWFPAGDTVELAVTAVPVVSVLVVSVAVAAAVVVVCGGGTRRFGLCAAGVACAADAVSARDCHQFHPANPPNTRRIKAAAAISIPSHRVGCAFFCSDARTDGGSRSLVR
jgi:hypothetical protein